MVHFSLTFFQLAQRNLLRYFSYNLSMPTPQAFLDELRIALPTLRDVLEYDHEWEDVSNETWKQLIAAARCTCHPTLKHLVAPFRSVGPSMLRFPVSLLTATALIEAIKRVICRRSSPTDLNAPAESLNPTYDCPTEHAAPGLALRGNIQEHENADLELAILRATSAVSEDIRKVLGLSMVGKMLYILVACLHPDASQEKTDECGKWLALVRSASEKPVFSKYFPR